jgi:outer membrane lipoprotein carrier protein
MSLKRALVAALAALTLFAASPALAEDTAPIVKAVEAKYSTVDAIQANFQQTTHNATFGDDVQSGEVTFKRPRKMFWNFTSGAKKQFVTDGTTMWVYTAEDNTVIRYDDLGSSAGSTTAESLLQSLDKLDTLFDIVILPATTGHALELTPKTAGQIKKVHLELDNDYVVQKVAITDAFDNVTEIAFTGVKLNPTVADTMFTFQVPAGAEVISAGH